jgi:hypothetical protein
MCFIILFLFLCGDFAKRSLRKLFPVEQTLIILKKKNKRHSHAIRDERGLLVIFKVLVMIIKCKGLVCQSIYFCYEVSVALGVLS